LRLEVEFGDLATLPPRETSSVLALLTALRDRLKASATQEAFTVPRGLTTPVLRSIESPLTRIIHQTSLREW
jgi:hypothetical protein